jgi:DNA invertase Pin-like site-specific DNA recombinase
MSEQKFPSGPGGAVYARISTETQDVTSQLATIDSYLKRHGLTVEPSRFFIDRGWSRADSETRPEFQRMLALVDEGAIKWILVPGLDRFGTPSNRKLVRYLDQLAEAGCSLWSAVEPELGDITDESLVTSILTTVHSARSHDDLTSRSKKSLAGRHKQATKGESVGGQAPYGYDLACVAPDGSERWRLIRVGYDAGVLHKVRLWPNGREDHYHGTEQPRTDPGERLMLSPSRDKERLGIITFIFDALTKSLKTVPEIATSLTSIGKKAPTPTGDFHPLYVRGILKNPAYYTGSTVDGKRSSANYFERRDGQIVPVVKVGDKAKGGRNRDPEDWSFCQEQRPALISRAQWDEAQRLLAEAPKRQATRKSDASMWMSGLVVCADCNQPMWNTKQRISGHDSGSYFCKSYGAYRRVRRAGPIPQGLCRHNLTPHDTLEQVVKRYLADVGKRLDTLVKLDPALILELAEEGWGEDQGDINLSDRLPADHVAYASARALDDRTFEFIRTLDRVLNEVKDAGHRPEKGKSWTHKTLAAKYREMRESRTKQMRDQLAKEEAKLSKMMGRFATLDARDEELQAIVQQQLTEQSAVVRSIKERLRPLDESLVELVKDVAACRDRFEQVRQVVRAGPERLFREKAVALRRVVSRIVVVNEPRGKVGSDPVLVIVEPVEGEAKKYDLAKLLSGAAPRRDRRR